MILRSDARAIARTVASTNGVNSSGLYDSYGRLMAYSETTSRFDSSMPTVVENFGGRSLISRDAALKPAMKSRGYEKVKLASGLV